MVWRGFYLLVGSAILGTGPAAARADNLVATVAAGNQASIGLIDTYFAEVKLVKKWEDGQFDDQPKGYEETRTAEYWRTRSRVRIREQFFFVDFVNGEAKPRPRPRIMDVEIIGDEARGIPTLSTNGKHTSEPGGTGLIIADRDRYFVEIDAWGLSLFWLPHSLTSLTPSPRKYTLAEAIQKGRVTLAEWSKLGERRVAHLVIDLQEDQKRVYEVWVDPARNWLITKCIYLLYGRDEPPEKGWRFEYAIEEWAEPQPALFVPTRVAYKTWLQGNHLNDCVATLAVKVNGPMPPVPAMPALEAGTKVHDEVRMESYHLDAQGRKTGPVSRVRGHYVAPAPPPAPDPLAPVAKPLRTVGWVLVGLAVLLAGLGLVVWRRRIRRTAA